MLDDTVNSAMLKLRVGGLFAFLVLAVPVAAQTMTIEFNLPANSGLFRGPGYRIPVPASASRLEVRAVTATCDTDISLFVRFGEDVVESGGAVQADYTGVGTTG